MIKTNDKAITLIALIITIIVMLILVGVTINVVISGGLMNTTKRGSYQTDASMIKELLEHKKAMVAATNANDYERAINDIEIDDLDLTQSLKEQFKDKLIVYKGTLYYLPEKVTNVEEQKWLEEIQIYKWNGESNLTDTEKATLEVGDYVRYASTKEGGYKEMTTGGVIAYATSDETGLGWAQGISRDIYPEEWRVLKIDGNKVTLISASASNRVNRITGGEDSYGRLNLKGEQLYNNGVEILNRMCDELYTTEYGKARSVKIEDINELVGYIPTESECKKITNIANAYYPNRYIDDYGSGVDTETVNTEGFTLSAGGVNINQSNIDNGRIVSITGNYINGERYIYTGYSQAESFLYVTPNSYTYSVTEENNGELIADLVLGDDRKSEKGAQTYWIASRVIHFNGAQAWFTMNYCNPTNGNITNDGYPFSSDSYGRIESGINANQRAHFLRPVIELYEDTKIDTTIKENGELTGRDGKTSDTAWIIE